MYKNEMKDEDVFIITNEKIKSFTGNKDEFIGKNNLINPQKILSNHNGLGRNSCIAVEMNIKLAPYEAKTILLNLGAKTKQEIIPMQYINIGKCEEELNKVKKYWYELLSKVHVNTPVESINIMLNGWGEYQSIVSRLWAKSGYYQSGGAIGFRDQLQDTLGIKFLDVNFMKNQIINSAKHQFIEGDVEHWWHEETRKRYKNKIFR